LSLNNEHVLITGAAGFIGANLTRYLLEKNLTVHALVTKTTDLWRLEEILSEENLVLHQIPNSKIQQLTTLLQKISPSIIFHLATTGAYFYQTTKKDIENTNLHFSLNLMHAAMSLDSIKSFIYTGSSVEYGPSNQPIMENSIKSPVNSYDWTKSYISLYGQWLYNQHSFPFVTAILYSVYGPYENPTRLIPTIFNSICQQKTLTINHPLAKRDFIYVEDVCEALWQIALFPQNTIGENFNIGSGKEFSIQNLIELIKNDLQNNKFEGTTFHLPKVDYSDHHVRSRVEPIYWQADVSKTKRVLGWQAPTSLSKGIKQTLHWFSHNQNLYLQDKQLIDQARKARKIILELAHKTNNSHIGSCFSCIDLLTYLYFKQIVNSGDRNDKFILSKGHAAMALYTVLHLKGNLSIELLQEYGQNGSLLGGHPKMNKELGIEISSGSLGHGLALASGLAYGYKLDNSHQQIYVLVGDGELQEGSVWESLLFTGHHQLDNLVFIIDRNYLESLGSTEDIVKLDPLEDKLRSFGWHPIKINGHDFTQIDLAFRTQCNGPKAIIAHTVKGKGVSFMENNYIWHYRSPRKDEYQKALVELDTN